MEVKLSDVLLFLGEQTMKIRFLENRIVELEQELETSAQAQKINSEENKNA